MGTKMTSPEEMWNPVSKPKYYMSDTGLETIQVIEAFAKDNPHRAMALKYLCRAGKKGDKVEDLRKAIWWIEREISRLEPPNPVEEALQGKLGTHKGKPYRPGDGHWLAPNELNFNHCEGCHSHVCRVTGTCTYAMRPLY